MLYCLFVLNQTPPPTPLSMLGLKYPSPANPGVAVPAMRANETPPSRKTRAAAADADVLRAMRTPRSAVQIRDNFQMNTTGVNQGRMMPNSASLIPETFERLLPARVWNRFRHQRVDAICRFGAFHSKHEQEKVLWEVPRFLVWQCKRGCGGLGDRMQSLIAVFLHAVAIGYEFRLDWASPPPLAPEILTTSPWINWTERSGAWSTRNGHSVRMMDQGKKPFNLCDWRNRDLVKVQTNGCPVPRGIADCERGQPNVLEVLQNQSLTQTCFRSVKKWKGANQCMGCTWWYLFRIGHLLQEKITFELRALNKWKRRHGLIDAFGLGLHLRAGDSHMGAGQGREAKDLPGLVHKMSNCASEFTNNSRHSKAYVLIVSDSEKARKVVQQWSWIPVYAVQTKPFHIDKSKRSSYADLKGAFVSVFVDLMLLSFQDALLLSGISGYGYLAQSVGLYADKNVVQCLEA